MAENRLFIVAQLQDKNGYGYFSADRERQRVRESESD